MAFMAGVIRILSPLARVSTCRMMRAANQQCIQHYLQERANRSSCAGQWFSEDAVTKQQQVIHALIGHSCDWCPDPHCSEQLKLKQW
jgi:hypothetical protein